MSWAIGYNETYKRDVGYGVPAYCDHPGCKRVIDRGLAYICGGDIGGGEHGCGLFFCEKHLYLGDFSFACARCVEAQCDHKFVCDTDEQQCMEDHHHDKSSHACEKCGKTEEEADNVSVTPFKPKREHPKWLKWKLKDSSWAQWRKENPKEVAKYRGQIKRAAAAATAKAVSTQGKSSKRTSKNVSRSHR